MSGNVECDMLGVTVSGGHVWGCARASLAAMYAQLLRVRHHTHERTADGNASHPCELRILSVSKRTCARVLKTRRPMLTRSHTIDLARYLQVPAAAHTPVHAPDGDPERKCGPGCRSVTDGSLQEHATYGCVCTYGSRIFSERPSQARLLCLPAAWHNRHAGWLGCACQGLIGSSHACGL